MKEFILANLLWFVLGGALLLAVLILAGVVALRNYKIKKLGRDGEKKVAAALRKFASIRGFKVINDLYLPLYDKTTQIDHVLIGFFGILVIETKNLGGEVYGDPKKKEWTHIIGGKKRELYNPLMQNQTHIDCMRHLFGKENLYNVNMESLIVFTRRKVELYVPNKLPIVKLKKLGRFLRQARFQEEKGFDVQKHYDVLMKYQVTDPKLIGEHNKNVKIMAKNNQ